MARSPGGRTPTLGFGASGDTAVRDVAPPLAPAPPTSSEQEAPVIPSGLVATAAPKLDPRLQRLVALRRSGGTTEATASTTPGEVAVVAVVKSLKAWTELSEVRPGASFPAEDGLTVVTGRIPLARIEAVRQKPFVKSLKAARPLKAALWDSTPSARADAETLRTIGGQRGRGCVVGIVDYGCDFAHLNFREANGDTRLEAIWDQGAANAPGAPFGYGRAYSRQEINAALRQSDSYTALGYGPAMDTQRSQGTHGTHVMDIAAGSGAGSKVAGFASEASLVFVDVSAGDVPWSGSDVVGASFGNSAELLEAVSFIFQQAGDRPCVVNISLGTNGGPHDGTTPVERGLDALLREKPNRAVVIAASNSYEDHIHATETLAANETVDLKWNRPKVANSEDELEIWTAGADRFAVELIMPDGSSLGVVEPGESGEATHEDEIVVLVANRLADPTNGDNMIGVYIGAGLPAGAWRVRLTAREVGADGRFHAWIERDDNSQAAFLDHVDNSHTVGSISCGHETLVVGSYDAHKDTRPLSWFSSAGPTRDGREKPELSAPGHDVAAAHSRTRDRVILKSGTSMASPAVAGGVALLFAEARHRGIDLPIAQTRKLVLDALNADGATAWDPRRGGGRLDVAAALSALPAASAPGGGAAAAAAKPSHRRAPRPSEGPSDKPKAPPRRPKNAPKG